MSATPRREAPARGGAALWHDVECASYGADLPLWRELASGSGGRVLDLGAGTGRVALDIAGRGIAVTAVDSEPELVGALAARARDRGAPVEAVVADVRTLALEGRRFSLAIAPMQVGQLLGGARGRRAMLTRTRAHLAPGARLAIALADPFEGAAPAELEPPLPDVLELDGWVFSSTPVAMREDADGTVAIDRLRQSVAPDGALSESMDTVRLERVEPATLEEEAATVELRPAGRLAVAATGGYVGSTVVLLEAAL